MSFVIQSLSGACSVTSCPGDSRCQVDRLHRASCVPEFQGCGQPMEIAGSYKTYEGHFLGASVDYTCKADFMECHSHTTSICQSTGQWEDASGLCGQFRWYNPDLDVHRFIPCGPRNRFRVTVVGTPTQLVRVTLTVMSGDDHLFYVDFRFNIFNTINKIVINSKLGGTWDTQIFLPFMPLTVGVEFNIEIILAGGVYTLVVDGVTIYAFTERYAGRSPEYVKVSKDVSLRLLEFTV